MPGYYYTICSLPCLSFADLPPLSRSAFFSLCALELSHDDLRTLGEIALVPSDTPATLLPGTARWYEWDRRLRQALSRLRAVRLGRSELTVTPDPTSPPALYQLAARVVALDDPQAAEDLLDQARWQFLHDQGKTRPFGLDKLGLYYLKLLLLERRASWLRASGQKMRQSILNRIHLPQSAPS